MADNRVQPRRHWLSFSLRTMFLALTVLSMPLGYVTWQVKIVRDRNELGHLVGCAGGYFTIHTYDAKAAPELRYPARAPWLRRLLGDRLYSSVGVPMSISEADFQRVIAAFPEAQVVRSDESPFTEPYPCETGKTTGD